MILRVQTTDPKLVKQLFVDDVNGSSGCIDLADDCRIVPQQPYEPTSGMIDVAQVLEFSATVGSNVACGILAAWIYDLIRHRGAKVEINGKDIDSEQANVEQITATVAEETKDAEDF